LQSVAEMNYYDLNLTISEYTIGKSTFELVIDNTSIIFITPLLIILQAQQTIKLVKKVLCTISAIEREPTERREYWTNSNTPHQG
jgi:hypothetical protein